MPEPGYHLKRDEDGLTKNERTCLNMLVGGQSRTEVADVLGISRERVRQLVKSLEAKGKTVPSRGYVRRTTPEGGDSSE